MAHVIILDVGTGFIYLGSPELTILLIAGEMDQYNMESLG